MSDNTMKPNPVGLNQMVPGSMRKDKVDGMGEFFIAEWSIGKAFLFVRKAKKYSQTEMAKKMDVSLRTYQGYERDERSPPVDKVIIFCKLEGIDIEHFLYGWNHKEHWSKLSLAIDFALDAFEYLSLERSELTYEQRKKRVQRLIAYHGYADGFDPKNTLGFLDD